MSLIGSLHGTVVFPRRTRVLATRLCGLLTPGARVLDIGCGDGLIDRLVMDKMDVSIEGIDTLVRPQTHVPVSAFDGHTIPFADHSFDVAMFVDVLHHTTDPKILLVEAARVATNVVIKDHLRNGLFSRQTLRLMDWVGNAHHGVVLPYNYLSKSEWAVALKDAGLRVDRMDTNLGLYPVPFTWAFDRGLHFVALCTSCTA